MFRDCSFVGELPLGRDPSAVPSRKLDRKVGRVSGRLAGLVRYRTPFSFLDGAQSSQQPSKIRQKLTLD
jgi:hypothetical protein